MATVRQTTDRNTATSTYTEMSFPKVLGPHAIILNFMRYSGAANVGAVTQRQPGGMSIALPIPNNLQDSFNMKVGGYELGATGNIARQSSDLATQYFQYGNEAFAGRGSDVVDAIASAAGQLGVSAVKSLASAVGGEQVIKGIEVGTGTIQNPFMALTFDGIDLKTHNFSWQLAPESAEDSEQLKKIIDSIKYHVTPGYKFGTRAFLEYPSMVEIFFMGTEDGYLYKFKRCMVNSFETNYAGGGIPAFLEGGKPAIVNITMALTEMEIWTKEDFGESVG